MAITKHYSDGRTEVEYTGCVLSERYWSYHVPSDNAMIDSGDGREVVVWGERGVETLHIGLGRPMAFDHITFTVDATPDVLARAVRQQTLQTWLADLRDADREHRSAVKAAQRCTKGRIVEVFKGRKAPKGKYVVDAAGEGDWGPYLHLRAADGKGTRYTYINPDNCRVVNPEQYTTPFAMPAAPFASTPLLDALARAYATLDTGRYGYQQKEGDAALSAFHDALEEAGLHDVAEVVGWLLGIGTDLTTPADEPTPTDYGASDREAAADERAVPAYRMFMGC